MVRASGVSCADRVCAGKSTELDAADGAGVLVRFRVCFDCRSNAGGGEADTPGSCARTKLDAHWAFF